MNKYISSHLLLPVKLISVHYLLLFVFCFSQYVFLVYLLQRNPVKILGIFPMLTSCIISMGIDTSWMTNIVLKLWYLTRSPRYSLLFLNFNSPKLYLLFNTEKSEYDKMACNGKHSKPSFTLIQEKLLLSFLCFVLPMLLFYDS